MPPTLNDPRQLLHDAEADVVNTDRLGAGWEGAGARLGGGCSEARRGLGGGWLEAARRLPGGFEEAGTEAWRRGGFQEASRRRGGFHRILFGIGTQNDVKKYNF